jgi:hypothetical protein
MVQFASQGDFKTEAVAVADIAICARQRHNGMRRI